MGDTFSENLILRNVFILFLGQWFGYIYDSRLKVIFPPYYEGNTGLTSSFCCWEVMCHFDCSSFLCKHTCFPFWKLSYTLFMSNFLLFFAKWPPTISSCRLKLSVIPGKLTRPWTILVICLWIYHLNPALGLILTHISLAEAVLPLIS